MLEYKKCANENCNKLTSKEYCRSHAKKYNTCSYINCGKNCKGTFCKVHNIENMQRRREKALQRYYKNRDEALQKAISN